VTGIGVAVIGYGYWGANLARNLDAASSTELIGIADESTDRQDAAKASLGEITTWSSLDEVLADDRVEAVVLSTPAAMHARMALQVIDAGRHVMVEKPLAMTSADADEVVAAAESSGLILMVGHTFLYSPPVHRLRESIVEGSLGNIQYLYSQRLSLGRIRRDCNALWNFAPHDISIMVYLLDEMPVEVSAKGFNFISEGIDDVCFASLTFGSGVGANLHVSWIDPRKTRLMTVVGDEKMAIYNDVSVDQKLWIVDAGVARSQDPGQYESMGDFQWRTRAGDINIPKIEMSEPLRNEMEAFGVACETGEAPVADGVHGAQVVRILEAIDGSASAGGRPTTIDWGA
jgi:predicted dehydrogenase